MLAAAAMLSGCAVNRDSRSAATSEVARDAAMQPLADVNIVRPHIAPELERILDDPYRLEAEPDCQELAFQITKLNRVLGPDYDVDIGDGDGRSRTDRGIALAGRMAAGVLIPFRSVVREVSGSASAEREYKAALIAGIARRSYLKGIARAEQCPLPRDPYAESLQRNEQMEQERKRREKD